MGTGSLPGLMTLTADGLLAVYCYEPVRIHFVELYIFEGEFHSLGVMAQSSHYKTR